MPQKTVEEVFETLFQSSGNTWITKNMLENFFYKHTKSRSLQSLNPYIRSDRVFVAQKDNELVFSIRKYALAEANIANNIIRIRDAAHATYSDEYLDSLIDEVEKKKNKKLHIGQRQAVKDAVNNLLIVLTGGPGTGKTTVLEFINDVLLLIDKDLQILYTAPTGKAARRITESTGFGASTLHKRLGITEEKMEPTPISKAFQMLTIDEVSMMDTLVAEATFKAVNTGMRLLLVGDIDQLPSVGPGSVLRDLIASGKIAVARLTKTFRQAGDSILFDNILRIQRGDYHLISGDDFKLAVPSSKISDRELLLYLYKKEIEVYGVHNVMCLTPYRKSGNTCSNIMNTEIQKMVNHNSEHIEDAFHRRFIKNDVVMQLENRDMCANGDVGFISKVYKNGIRVKYTDSECDYSINQLNQLDLAYAMSIHKSQGSQAKSVVTCLLPEHKAMMQRNLPYTAITRAEKKCTLLCEPEIVKYAIENEASSKRLTMLQEQISKKG